MKHLIDFVRDGCTNYYASSGRVEFRKPHTFDPDKHKISDYKFAQAKPDGHRVLVVGHLEERWMSVITSNGTDVTDEVMQCQWANLLHKRMTDLEYFDGELYLPGHGREALSTAMAERSKDIRFAVFGCSSIPPNGSMEAIDKVVHDRKCDLDTPVWERIGDPTGRLLSLTQEPATVESLLAGVKRLGVHYDGIVLKQGMYGSWLKFKHTLTIDLAIIGIKPAKEGQFLGQCGSLLCGCYDGDSDIVYEVACVSGMDTTIRASITDSDVGRVCEVAYERIGTRGRLQHPRFISFRDDKKPEQCHLAQDPLLEKFWTSEEDD
jgi:hypothetical protein